jgi:Arm DNA-binding domain
VVSRITDKLVKSLAKPSKGAKIYYGNELKGVGISVSASGNRSFILRYTIHGHEKRMTIGQFPAWTVYKARGQANTLQARPERI